MEEQLTGGSYSNQTYKRALAEKFFLNNSDIEEIEKAAILGLGLKKPLFETAKEIGIKNIVDELNKLAEKHGEFYKPDPLLISMQ